MGMPHVSSDFQRGYARAYLNSGTHSHRRRRPEDEPSGWPPSPVTLAVDPQQWPITRTPTADAATLGLRSIVSLTPSPRTSPIRAAPQAARQYPSQNPQIDRILLPPDAQTALHKLLQHNPALVAVLRERAAVAALRLIRHLLSGYDKLPSAAIHALLADIHALLSPPPPPPALPVPPHHSHSPYPPTSLSPSPYPSSYPPQCSPSSSSYPSPTSPSNFATVHAVRAAGHGLDGAQAGLLPPDSAGRCPMPECETVCADACARYDHLRGPARCVLCGGGAMWSQGELLGHLALHLARFL